MTVFLIWWYCSMSTCVVHSATYADKTSCEKAREEIVYLEKSASICVER